MGAVAPQERLGLIEEEALRVGRRPAREVLVHVVTVTDGRAAAAVEMSNRMSAPLDDILGTPFALIGTPETDGGADAAPRPKSSASPATSFLEVALESMEEVLPLLPL